MRFRFSRDLFVNQALRKELSKPFGKIMRTQELMKRLGRKETVYAIGDVTLAELLKRNYKPKIGIFDYRTERNITYFPIIRRTYRNPIRVKNDRGTLSKSLWIAIRRSSKTKSQIGIRVDGEEDLASLACVYFARHGDFVIYGMRGKGMAVIKVNKGIKDYVIRVLNTMSRT